MKHTTILTLACTLTLCSCATTEVVEVRDSKSNLLIGGASVISKNGTYRSLPNYTNACGIAPIPQLPQGVKQVEVSKSGYNSTTVSAY